PASAPRRTRGAVPARSRTRSARPRRPARAGAGSDAPSPSDECRNAGMDIERFVAGLPALFEDFPSSPHPRGTRFDDVLARTPNLAEENVLALLNLAASLLAAGESYVEVGSYFGASLIGAMRGNDGDFVAIDRFSFDVPEVRGRKLPRASRAGLEESLRRFGEERATILEGDAFELVEGGALGERRV